MPRALPPPAGLSGPHCTGTDRRAHAWSPGRADDSGHRAPSSRAPPACAELQSSHPNTQRLAQLDVPSPSWAPMLPRQASLKAGEPGTLVLECVGTSGQACIRGTCAVHVVSAGACVHTASRGMRGGVCVLCVCVQQCHTCACMFGAVCVSDPCALLCCAGMGVRVCAHGRV